MESLFHVGSGVSAPPCDQDFTLQPERCLSFAFPTHEVHRTADPQQCLSCINGTQKGTPVEQGSTAPGMDMEGHRWELCFPPPGVQRAK